MRLNEKLRLMFHAVLISAIIAFSFACTGKSGSGENGGEPSTYSLSGQVTCNGTGLSGVTVALSGISTGTTTTDNNGNYSFTGLSNGSYTVTPSIAGYSCDPSSRDTTISGSNQTAVNFATSASISGQVTTNGAGLSGVTMTLSGTSTGTTTTDSNGNYSFTGLSNGSFTVTPSLSGHTFDPLSSDITITGPNQTDVNFATSASISGQVTTNGTGLSGVTLTLSGTSTGTTTTDSNGNYSFTGLSNGSYTVTPSLTDYTCDPLSRDITITGPNQTAVNFATSASISGQVATNGTGLSGVTMTLSGTSTGTSTTDNNGNYSFTGLSNGSYTVTPSLAGYTFDPLTRDITISGSNQIDINFATSAYISGQVATNGTGLSGVTVTLSGTSIGTTTTDSNGNYSFTGLSNGSYTVTPSLTGYTFDPLSRDITITGPNQTDVNFATSAYISGQVATNGTGLSGVTVTLSGTSTGTSTTDNNGNYSFTDLSNGSYTVTPSLYGYTFTPVSRNVTVSGPNISGVDFLGEIVEADASVSQTVNKYTKVALDGSGSTGATSYKWTQKEGPSIDLSDNTTIKPTFTPISADTYVFSLEVSSGIYTDEDTVDIVVQNISSVYITSPTGEAVYATNQYTIMISGNVGEHIQSVILTNEANSTTYNGVINIDRTFTVSDVFLVVDDNKLTVTGTDNIGATTVDDITVTCNPYINFLSAPTIDPDSAFENESTEVTVRIAIESNPNLISDSVKLINVDNDNNILSEIATLQDDGDVLNGDDIAGDGVYSAITTITESTAGTIFFRVSADTGSMGYSTMKEFSVLSPLTDEQIQEAQGVIQQEVDDLPAAGVKFTKKEFSQMKDQIVANLLSNDLISAAQLSDDGDSISASFKSGLSYNVTFIYGGSKGGEQNRLDSRYSKKKVNKNIIQYYPVSKHKSANLASKILYMAAESKDSTAELMGSFKAAAFSPFEWQFGGEDDIYGAYEVIENSQSPEFQAEPAKTNYNVTCEDFKNLSKYGIVVISSHGAIRRVKMDISGDDPSKWKIGYRVPVIFTAEEATAEKQKTYQGDIDAERLIIGYAKILIEDGGFLWFDSKEIKAVFLIAPDFITKYNNNLSNTIIYMSICKGLTNDKLAESFINAGAGAFLGYTDIVNTGYAFNCGKTFFEEMVAGKNVEEAVNSAISAHGENDADFWWNFFELFDDTPAAFEYRGKANLVLEKTDILNGGFEDNFKYWDSNGGDARIISELASLTPQEGLYMAIISSGLGEVTDSNIEIFQQFKVPADAQTLSFIYDVVSEEPMEWVGSGYDDKFEVVIIDSEGNEGLIAYETINTSTWIAIDGGQSDGGMFNGGDTTTFHTNWKEVIYDISSFVGKTVTLKFHVWDVGDSIYDTAALIDKIQLN